MNKLGIVLGATALVVAAGCMDPNYELPGHIKSQNDPAQIGPETPEQTETGVIITDVTPVAEEVLRGVTVVLNLDKLNKEDSRRFLDFLGGVIFSIDGGIKKVAASTYVVTPRNVDVYDSSRLATRENIGDFDR